MFVYNVCVECLFTMFVYNVCLKCLCTMFVYNVCVQGDEMFTKQDPRQPVPNLYTRKQLLDINCCDAGRTLP